MHIYEQFQQKIAFSGPHIPLCVLEARLLYGKIEYFTICQSKRAKDCPEPLATYQ
jgi:hypothetical protein